MHLTLYRQRVAISSIVNLDWRLITVDNQLLY
jgi:hypothetical protein